MLYRLLVVPISPISVVSSAALFLLACGRPGPSPLQEAWNAKNDPTQLGVGYEHHFDKLPLTGLVKQQPWSDTYWPSSEGGIARRWNVDQPYAFKFQPPDAKAVKAMALGELATLSPAEKFDIYTGDYHYPLFHYVRKTTAPDRPSWEGICQGWAASAVNYDEPRPVLATGADGVKIPFGADDVKALLDLFNGSFAGATARTLASRCDIDLKKHPEAANTPDCRGVNPGSFQIILSNFLGRDHKPFIANTFRATQIWNQPVYAFNSKVLSRHDGASKDAAPGTEKEIEIETKMDYVEEIDPSWQAVAGTDDEATKEAVYHYRVELDHDGAIIGGTWLQDERPGFIWTAERVPFTGMFAKLEDLYKTSSTASTYYPNPRTGR